MSWKQTTLGEVIDLKRGFDLPSSERKDGAYRVYSSSGQTGTHAIPAVSGPCVITGRYGTIGNVYFSADDCWPLNTSLYSTDFKGNNPRFIYHLLRRCHGGSTQPQAPYQESTATTLIYVRSAFPTWKRRPPSRLFSMPLTRRLKPTLS